MPGRASLKTSVEKPQNHPDKLENLLPRDYYEEFFDEVYNDLKELVNDRANYGRVERDFGNDPVFVQTDDYNAFLDDDGVVFHGLEEGADYMDEEDDSLPGEVFSYLEEIYGVDDWDEELNWWFQSQ